jgi:hypothetical protein
VQLLAKVLNDEVDLKVSHDHLLLTILLPNWVAHTKIDLDWTAPKDQPHGIADWLLVRLAG